LRAIAYRMLGSLSEAEDAVQEAWIRLERTDMDEVENMGGWLTTVVSRVCLDMLRTRKARREEAMDIPGSEPVSEIADDSDPEREMSMADEVGLALLVVLKKLAPAERVAYVLHDMFDIGFDEIAPVVGRNAAATRQLASRARRRVEGTSSLSDMELTGQRAVVDAFLAASRNGDFQALLTVLDPDVVFRADAAAMRLGASAEVRGASTVANAFLGKAQAARSVLLDGSLGIIVAPRGKTLLVLNVTIVGGRIVELSAVADPDHLGRTDVALIAA
jgi:RNA polymerase sigma-70 factor (ECF subfamily)